MSSLSPSSSCSPQSDSFHVTAKQSGTGGGFSDEPSAADTATQWRRAGPLPSRGGQQQSSNRYESSAGGGFGSSGAAPGADVDWGAARGTKFVARPDNGPSGQFGGGSGGFNRGGPPREFGSGREPRDQQSMGLNSLDDVPADWRSSRPARAQPPPMEARDSFRGAGGAPMRGGFAEREVGLSGEAATEESVSASRSPYLASGGFVCLPLLWCSGVVVASSRRRNRLSSVLELGRDESLEWADPK